PRDTGARPSASRTWRAPCAGRFPRPSPWLSRWWWRLRRKATTGSTRSSTTAIASWRESKRGRCGSSPATGRTGRRSSRRSPALRFSEHVRGQGREFFENVRTAGLEGVVSKRASAPYREGRGGDWRKAKCRLSQEVAIGGFTLSSDGGGSIGALLVGFHEDGKL